MDITTYKQTVTDSLAQLFSRAREKEELGFVFSILGIDSGAEDAGWSPIAETEAFVNDLLWLINSPLKANTKMRMGLVLYCQIMESSYFYHIIYNLMQTIKGETPKTFNFLTLYEGSKPPSVSRKVKAIKNLGKEVEADAFVAALSEIYYSDIRNAFLHSDYILYDGEVRLKHKGSRIMRIKFEEVWTIIKKTMHFYEAIMRQQYDSLRSYKPDHKLIGRKSSSGHNIASINLLVDESTGMLTGFSCDDPLPIW